MSKTFRTVGSGLSQTLHQIEDEKIPVYATKADLEADLANLEEGQIVATEDGSYSDDSMTSKLVIRHNYSITGTSNAIADTQALVNHILTLDKGTYAGEFKRTGVTFGNYELTYFIDGDGSKSVLGLVNYGISSSSGDQTYQVSYVLAVGSSTPTWVIRPISNVFSKEFFGSDTMDQTWDQAQQNQTLRIGCLPYDDTRNPTLAEYTSYGIPAQNVEVHAGYYTVTAYSFDGRVFTYDKTNGWINTTARDIQRYDINVPTPPSTVTTMFEALRYQLMNANWTNLTARTGRTCTGQFNLTGWYFGQYTGTHHGSGYMTITGTINYGGMTHTFSAYYDPSIVNWKFAIDGQYFISVDGGFVFTKRQIDNMYVYNVTGAGTYQAFITALTNNGLMIRPSRGEVLIIPDSTRIVNGKDLVSSNPPYTSTWPASAGWWLQNPMFSSLDTTNQTLYVYWSDVTSAFNCNLWGINWGVTTIQANLEFIV